jgi:hypothetical protein
MEGDIVAKKDPGPRVKDRDLYERLRGAGVSRKIATRVANSTARAGAGRHGQGTSAETGQEGNRKCQRADRDHRSLRPATGTAALATEPYVCSSRGR